jgi:hypothetical protein
MNWLKTKGVGLISLFILLLMLLLPMIFHNLNIPIKSVIFGSVTGFLMVIIFIFVHRIRRLVYSFVPVIWGLGVVFIVLGVFVDKVIFIGFLFLVFSSVFIQVVYKVE